MNTIKIKAIFSNTLTIFWAVFVTILFTFYSGTISHLYDSSFANWHKFSQKFLQIDFFSYAQNLLVSAAGVLCFTLACLSLGSIFINKDNPLKDNSHSNKYSLLVTAFLFGEILFSFMLIGLGILARLTLVNTITVLLFGGAIGILTFKNLFHTYPSKSEATKRKSIFEKLIFWLSMVVLASSLLLSTARISYDSTAFYFSDSKLIAMTDRLIFFPNDGFVVSSFHTGILYTALIQIFGDQAARLFSWISGAFIILISMALAEELGFSYRTKLIVFAMLITSTAFTDPFGDGKIELTTTLPAITAIFWLVKAEKESQLNNYLFAGIFAGFSIISRPYNLVLLGGLVSFLFLINKTPLLPRIKHYTLLFVPILIMLSLHLAINWLILGDLLAPLHNTSKVNTEIWQWSGFDPKNIWFARIFFLFVGTFLNTPQSMGNITPIILIFLPAFLHKKTRENLNLSYDLKRISLISFFVLTIWIMVYFTIFEIRYVFFLWILIYFAVAAMIDTSLENLEPVSKKIFSGIVILLLLYIGTRNIFIAVDAYAPIDKNGTAQCNDSPFCFYLWPINQNANTGERVLGLSAFRYYFRPDLFACSSKANEYQILQNALKKSNEDFWVEVHNQGYTYIAYEENYSKRHLFIDFLPTLKSLPNWVKLERLSESFNGYFSTYKIEYVNAPNKISKKCDDKNGIWFVEDIP